MHTMATRPHPNPNQIGTPSFAKPCVCEHKRDDDQSFGDEREGTCAKCGRQVDGRQLPARGAFSLAASSDRSRSAPKRHRGGL